ncbi:MAG: polysaccharide biosynthesis/export family protein, partial [Candidatus Sulfotelmatobacter sp.]
MKNVTKLAWLALLGFAALGMGAQDDGSRNATKAAKEPAPEVQRSAAQVPAEYVIGADDTLHISVWKEPDLT